MSFLIHLTLLYMLLMRFISITLINVDMYNLLAMVLTHWHAKPALSRLQDASSFMHSRLIHWGFPLVITPSCQEMAWYVIPYIREYFVLSNNPRSLILGKEILRNVLLMTNQNWEPTVYTSNVSHLLSKLNICHGGKN